jgi:glycosyltransferase involved in cell wall biosynthesis
MSPAAAARESPLALSVVMPAHNESGFLEQSLKTLVGALRERDRTSCDGMSRGRTFEVVVVENGSTDGTFAEAQAFAVADDAVVVLTRAAADYGEAMRAGILAARGDVVVVFDVDYFDPEFVDVVLPRLTAPDGPAIVVGSKRAPGTRDARPWPRRAITAGFSTLLRVGFGLSVSDTHGMKGMRRTVVDPVVRRCRNGTDLFDTELVLRADRAGLAVAEVPVTVEERRPSRTPITRRIARTMVGLVRLRVQLWSDPQVRSSVARAAS